MKSLVTYLTESEGSQFKIHANVTKKDFDNWKKSDEAKDYDIIYSEDDRLYAVYKLKDKSNPMWKGKHVATYDCRSGELYCDDKSMFKEFVNRKAI